MNCIQCLRLKSLKFLNLHVKSFSVTSYHLSYLFSAQVKCYNSKLFIDQYNILQKTQVRGGKYFRRRPINVLENVDGKYMQDYINEQEIQAGVLHSDETEFPTRNNNDAVPLQEEEITKKLTRIIPTQSNCDDILKQESIPKPRRKMSTQNDNDDIPVKEKFKTKSAEKISTQNYDDDFLVDEDEFMTKPRRKKITTRSNYDDIVEEDDEFILEEDDEIFAKPKRKIPTQYDDLPLEEEVNIKSKKGKKGKNQAKTSSKEKKEKTIPENFNKKNVVFKNLNVQQYSKASPTVRSYLEEGKSAYIRESEDFFYVEGWRLLGETLNKGLKPLAIFFSRSRLFYNLIPTVATTEEELCTVLNLYPLYKTPYKVFELWSSLRTPPGVIGVFRISEASEKSRMANRMSEHSFPLSVVLDEIRDPNNLGSIFRTIVAAGVQQVILMKGCCDIWDPKVFRATCGAQLHMNCLTKVPWKFLEAHLPPSPSVFLADSYFNLDLNKVEQEDASDDEPAADGKETLLALEEGLTESEKNTVYETTYEGEKLRVNYSYEDPEHLHLFRNIEFPKTSYEDAEFFVESDAIQGQNTVLIIGGEKGLSVNAKKFALESNAVQVGIPLANEVESLNSSVVTGILVYCAQKQYNCIKKKQKPTQSVANDS